MKTRLVWIVSIVVFNSASARTFEQTVTAGRSTVIKTYRSWDTNCAPTKGVVKLQTRPQHGRLTVKNINSVVPEIDFANVRTACAGKPSPGFQITYMPVPGYVGIDSFSVNVLSDGRWNWSDDFIVTVK